MLPPSDRLSRVELCRLSQSAGMGKEHPQAVILKLCLFARMWRCEAGGRAPLKAEQWEIAISARSPNLGKEWRDKLKDRARRKRGVRRTHSALVFAF